MKFRITYTVAATDTASLYAISQAESKICRAVRPMVEDWGLNMPGVAGLIRRGVETVAIEAEINTVVWQKEDFADFDAFFSTFAPADVIVERL